MHLLISKLSSVAPSLQFVTTNCNMPANKRLGFGQADIHIFYFEDNEIKSAMITGMKP